MAKYLLRRVLMGLAVLLAVSTVIFLALRLAGDPIALLVTDDVPPDIREEIRRDLGLDQPTHIQYIRFLQGAVKGNLGFSFYFKEPAMQLVVERIPASLQLVFGTMLISVVLAIPLGVAAATRRGTTLDRSILLGSLFGISAPPFWVGIILILIFAVNLKMFPSSGRGTWAHVVLPAASLSFFRIALFVRLVRAGMLDVMELDYIRTARAKGLPERVVIYKHALKNTMIPIVTLAGLQMGALLTGAIITERIFAWPGMGWLILESLQRLDYPVVVAYAVVTASIFVGINLVVDMIYSLLDPKVRYA